ncbi:MAG: hypothetical protein LBU95_03390 [Rikenellaceae bacterium]|jgi:hypothetical protein|nr:hypothetical protein [Rikenellaceae bacterium]
MKKLFPFLTLALFAAGVASAQERSLFSNVGVSLNAGTTGVGATLSTPLGKHFNLRAGFGVLPYTYKYTTEDLEIDLSSQLRDAGAPADAQFNVNLTHSADLKARLKVPAMHVMVDYNPFKGGLGAFHLTAGLFMGGNNLAHVNGDAHFAQLQQKIDGMLGDIRDQVDAKYPGYGSHITNITVSDVNLAIADEGVRLNPDGTADAYLKVNSIRPYFGLGWGNAIPKRRVGFRFDIGALYQGKPKIASPNYMGDLNAQFKDEDDLNKIMDNAKFWPQISFQLTFRLLKDKK